MVLRGIVEVVWEGRRVVEVSGSLVRRSERAMIVVFDEL